MELFNCIKFDVKLNKMGTETYEMIETALREEAMGHGKVFKWFCHFKHDRTYPESGKHSVSSLIEQKL